MLKKWHWITKAAAAVAILVFVLGCLPAGSTETEQNVTSDGAEAKLYITSDDAEAKSYAISDDAEDGQCSRIDFAETEQNVQTEFAAVYAQPKINLMIQRTKEEESTQKEQMPETLKEEAAKQKTKAEKAEQEIKTEKTEQETKAEKAEQEIKAEKAEQETKIKKAEQETKENNKEEKNTGLPSVFCTAKDYQVLLNIVQAEAGGCDAIGKILVANVILNRVKSEVFPDTITDVVYEKSQFSPAMNGTIDQVKVSDSTKKSVIRALSGEDYSQGALYFMNRRSSQSGNTSWFDRKLTYLFQYEGHEFFK